MAILEDFPYMQDTQKMITMQVTAAPTMPGRMQPDVSLEDLNTAASMIPGYSYSQEAEEAEPSRLGKVIKAAWKAVKEEPARKAKFVDRLGNWVREQAGMEPFGPSDKQLVDYLKTEDFDKALPDEIEYKIGNILGGAGVGVAELAILARLGIPPQLGMAGLGAIEAYGEGGGVKEVGLAALGGATLGTVYKKVAPLSRLAKAALLGTAGAGITTGETLAARGELPTTGQVAESALTQAGFGLLGPGNKSVTRKLIKRGWSPDQLDPLNFNQKLGLYRMRVPPPDEVDLTLAGEGAPTKPSPTTLPGGMEAFGKDLYEEPSVGDVKNAQEAEVRAAYVKNINLKSALKKRGFDGDAIDLLTNDDLEYLITNKAKPEKYIVDKESLDNPEKTKEGKWKLAIQEAGKAKKKMTTAEMEDELGVTMSSSRAAFLRAAIAERKMKAPTPEAEVQEELAAMPKITETGAVQEAKPFTSQEQLNIEQTTVDKLIALRKKTKDAPSRKKLNTEIAASKVTIGDLKKKVDAEVAVQEEEAVVAKMMEAPKPKKGAKAAPVEVAPPEELIPRMEKDIRESIPVAEKQLTDVRKQIRATKGEERAALALKKVQLQKRIKEMQKALEVPVEEAKPPKAWVTPEAAKWAKLQLKEGVPIPAEVRDQHEKFDVYRNDKTGEMKYVPKGSPPPAPEAPTPKKVAKEPKVPAVEGLAVEPAEGTPEFDIWVRSQEMQRLRWDLGLEKLPRAERTIGAKKGELKLAEKPKLSAAKIQEKAGRLKELESEIKGIQKEVKAGTYKPEAVLPEPKAAPRESDVLITEAEKKMLREDFGLKDSEFAGWTKGEYDTFLEGEGYRKEKAPTKPAAPEKTDAELLKEQGVTDDDVLNAILNKYTAPVTPAVEVFKPTETIDPKVIRDKLGVGAQSETRDIAKKANIEAATIRKRITQLEADKATLMDYIRPDMHQYLDAAEIVRIRGEIKDLSNEISNLSKSLSDVDTVKKSANKQLASKIGLDPRGMAVGDVRPLRTVQIANQGGKIAAVKEAKNIDKFGIISTKEGSIPQPTEEPVVRGSASVMLDKKGNPVITQFEVDKSLGAPFEDQLLDSILDFYGKTKDPKVPAIDPNAAGNAVEVMNRRKPVEQRNPEYMEMTLGFFGSPDAYKKTYQELRDIVRHSKQAISEITKVTKKELRSPEAQKRALMLRKMGKVQDIEPEIQAQIAKLPSQVKGVSEQGKRAWATRQVLSMKDSTDPSFTRADTKTQLGIRDLVSLWDIMGDPAVSLDKTIRFVGKRGRDAEQVQIVIAKGAKEYIEKNLGWLRDDKKAQKEFMRQMHGIAESKDPKIITAHRKYMDLMNDFAAAANLVERGMMDPKYGTVTYDLNKMYDWYKKPIMRANEYKDLSDVYRSYIEPSKFNLIKSTIEAHERAGRKTWDSLPDFDQAELQQNLFSWNNGFMAYEYLPTDAQVNIPKEKWNAFFQPKKNFVAPGLTRAQTLDLLTNSNPLEVIGQYIDATTSAIAKDKFLRDVRGVINEQAGSNNPLTKRGYLERYAKQIVYGRKVSAIDQGWNAIAKQVNSTFFGENVIPLFVPTRFASGITRGMYRGLLGPDTAVRNLTQSVNTWAESGKVPIFKALNDRMHNSKEWQDFEKTYSLLAEFTPRSDKGTKWESTDALRNFSRKVTDVALSPMNFTEKINKFLQYMAGLEEARALKLDFDTAHLIGLDRAFKTVESPQMTEAQYFAWNKVWQTQFGYTRAHSSPYLGTNPIARISTIFWSYPAKTLQLWRTGILESIMAKDTARLLRYGALVGFSASAPLWFGQLTGLNVAAIYGKGMLPFSVTPLWMNIVKDAYTIAGGDASAYDKEKSKRSFQNNIASMSIPWYRFGKKVVNNYENAQRGYVEYGQTGQPLVETNDFKEICSLFGFPPETTAAAREARRRIKDEMYDVQLEKTRYLDKLAKALEDRDYVKLVNGLQNARQEGIEVSYGDILDRQRRKQQTTWEVLRKMSPKAQKKYFTEELTKAEEEFLPRRRSGTKSMWQSDEEE